MAQADRREFVEQVLKVVRARFPLVKIKPMTDTFAVSVNGSIASLENIYRSSALSDDDGTHQIERWMVELLRASEGLPDETAGFDELKERIFPMILRAPAIDDERQAVVMQSLVGNLVIAYAIDNDRTISYILRNQFDNWKIDQDTLHETAINNLIARSEAINAQAAQDDDGQVSLVIFRTGDDYDSSRLLLPTLHDRLREYLGSPFGAAIPNRGILLCFRNAEPMVSRIRQQVKSDYQNIPHQVTDDLLLVTADGIAMRD
jgi:uncharacterized protein YtpQ (UPF0354 family)